MPRHRPAASGYARLAQADEDERSQGLLEDSEDEDPFRAPSSLSPSTPRYAPVQPSAQPSTRGPASGALDHRPRKRPSRRTRSNSGVDIKAINARLEKWAEEIASKFKINKSKGKSPREERLEIHHSVFQPPDWIRPLSAENLVSDVQPPNDKRMTKVQVDDLVESVRVAIENGVHPKMIAQGSSGSYFARNSDGKVVGVFKPKDEEPYASRNPKWTKWFHRNLFPFAFGRACLIPNLSYVSEAAAYVLDSRLRTNLVPYTDIVWLSSRSFYYDIWDRRRYWRGKKKLPAKQGSFQVFLNGYKDANIFLREHPWPDQNNSGFRTEDTHRRKRRGWVYCRPFGTQPDDEDEGSHSMSPPIQDELHHQQFHWTDKIKQSFREELEKLVILDYIMRNTDRGLDNWMIKIDWLTEKVSILSEPPKLDGNVISEPVASASSSLLGDEQTLSNDATPYQRQAAMAAASRTGTPSNIAESSLPSISLGAIDNSLSWPWKHPDAWRSFPFGWLFLPVSLIGQPFSVKTREHFLPLLTSTSWWSETQLALRRVFSQDCDFKEGMFARQIAVMKGQAWNVVETLKDTDHGPLELTRRTRVCVWDDLVDIPVAIPLRVPSAELKRQAAETRQEEEMDIGAAYASTQAPSHDLLGMASPASALPNPNRFDLSRDQSWGDLGRIHEDPSSPATISDLRHPDQDGFGPGKRDGSNSATLPTRAADHVRSQARSSLEHFRAGAGGHNRRHSNTYYHRTSNPVWYDRDDLEGDLGYSAAQGMEGSQKKVIVERLETVKSKNPVFTWC